MASEKMFENRFLGFFFSYEIRSDRLRLLFMRFLPLSVIYLKDVEYMRLAASNEQFSSGSKRIWPSFSSNSHGQNPLYLIKTRKKRKKYFLRMNSSFHYKVRSAISSEVNAD